MASTEQIPDTLLLMHKSHRSVISRYLSWSASEIFRTVSRSLDVLILVIAFLQKGESIVLLTQHILPEHAKKH